MSENPSTSSEASTYASDRHLLLSEVKMLSNEVGRLRGDTRGLVQEEVRRGRLRRYTVGVLAFLLLAIPLVGFYVQAHRANADRADFQRRTLAVCQARNKSNTDFTNLLNVLLSQPRRPGQPPPDPKVLAAFQHFLTTLKTVDCQRLLTGKE